MRDRRKGLGMGAEEMPKDASQSGGVSIAMATYNGEAYIAEQLQSLAAQTLLPAELVVTDDRSTDATLSIVKSFAITAPFPVRIVKNSKRLGFQDNFLKAAGLCQSDYIAFCDQDDVWDPEKLQVSLEALTHSDALLATHGATVTDKDLKPIAPLQQGLAVARTYEPLSLQPIPGDVYGFTMVFHRSLLGLAQLTTRPDVPGEPGVKLYHDVWIAMIASVFSRIVHIERPLVFYRQHANNALGEKNKKSLERLLLHVEVPEQTYINRMTYARQCAAAFNKIEQVLYGFDAERAREAISLYMFMSNALQDRIDLYNTKSVLARFTLLHRMAKGGAYSDKDRGGLGFRAFVKDLVFSTGFGLLSVMNSTPRKSVA